MGSKKSFEELKSVLESECRWGKTSENIEKEGYSLNFDYSKKTAFLFQIKSENQLSDFLQRLIKTRLISNGF